MQVMPPFPLLRAVVLAGLALGGGLGSAQAREGASGAAGIGSAMLVPAPVVVPTVLVVPTRPVLVAPAVPARTAAVPEAGASSRGGLWHRASDRQAQGRSDFWQYGGPAVPGASVVVQAASPAWVR